MSIFKDDATTGQKLFFWVWVLFEVLYISKKVRDIRKSTKAWKQIQGSLGTSKKLHIEDVATVRRVPEVDLTKYEDYKVRFQSFDVTPYTKSQSPGTKPYDEIDFVDEG